MQRDRSESLAGNVEGNIEEDNWEKPTREMGKEKREE